MAIRREGNHITFSSYCPESHDLVTNNMGIALHDGSDIKY